MSNDRELDYVISKALESAELRAGDSIGSTTGHVLVDVEAAAVDGDGD